MSPLPLPIRLAAGLAAVAVERARKLPQDVTEWPMSAVSQALQLSMRVQQRITELAIKGDEALAGLREAEEDPPWAVFDEDLPAPAYLRPQRSAYDLVTDAGADADADELDDDAWLDDQDELADLERLDGADPADVDELDTAELDEPLGDVEPVAAADPLRPPAAPVRTTETPDTGDRDDGPAGAGPVGLPAYPGLSLPSVRARLRSLTVADLEDLLAYERGHHDRPEFVRMLTNRIATVRGR